MLGSSRAGSSRSRQPGHLSFSITSQADYESHRERAPRRGKERISATEARIAPEATGAAAQAAAEEEAIHARIVKKRQWRNTRALVREQNRTVRAMVRLPPMKEKADNDGEDSSGNEQFQFDPYCVFDRYFREKDGKDVGKGQGSRG